MVDEQTMNNGEAPAEPASDELQAEREKAQGYLANWQRAEADFQNYKKRVEQERVETERYASRRLILDLLPVLDDLERALASAGDAGAGLVKGVELTRRNFASALERHGVSEIPALGERFDPHIHEAALQGEGPDGQVVEVLNRGYRLHDRVIRPAMVKVGNGQ